MICGQNGTFFTFLLFSSLFTRSLAFPPHCFPKLPRHGKMETLTHVKRGHPCTGKGNRWKRSWRRLPHNSRILDYLEHCQANMVCSRQLYAEALGNDGNPAQWEIREINDIMNNCSDWIAFSNPRHFPEPYRRQKGWEKPDNKGQDFQPITKEQMEQLSLPAEWMQW